MSLPIANDHMGEDVLIAESLQRIRELVASLKERTVAPTVSAEESE